MMHKLSPELINTICTLGVENRYSAMENYADFLTGAEMNPTSSTTDLGVNATRKCIEEWGGDPSQIGLLIAATNTPDQMLPCLASEVMARTHGLLPRSLSTVSMQSQGCSVMLKSVEVAQWYLAANPGKMAIVLMSEAHTPFVAPLLRDEYFGFREIARMRKNNKSHRCRVRATAHGNHFGRSSRCCSVMARWLCFSARTSRQAVVRTNLAPDQ